MLWFQNNISKISYGIVFVLLYALEGQAQLITVQDPAFRNALCAFDPTIMSNNCSSLDTIKATTANGDLEFNFMNINSADELIYFKNADTIRISNNNLKSFPVDLSGLTRLYRLQLGKNQLTNAPDIHYTNAATGDFGIGLVYLLHNKITYLPPSWSNFNGKAKVIDLYNNDLTSIPTFINYTQLRRFDIRLNRLGFESLIPFLSNPRWSTSQFDLFPQKNFTVSLDTLVEIGDVLQINISTGLTSNEYSLYIDSTIIETNRTGTFSIPITAVSDTGKYWFKIRNDNFPGTTDFLQSENKHIQLKPINEKHKDVIVFSPNGDGNADAILIDGTGQAKIINKNGVELKNISLPYIWDGSDKYGKVSSPDLYYIQKSDGSVLKVLLVN